MTNPQGSDKNFDRERTVLSTEDWEAVLAALENPAEPTEALRQAKVLHDAVVIRSD